MAKNQLVYHQAIELKRASRFSSNQNHKEPYAVAPTNYFAQKKKSKVSIKPSVMSLGKEIPAEDNDEQTNIIIPTGGQCQEYVLDKNDDLVNIKPLSPQYNSKKSNRKNKTHQNNSIGLASQDLI